MPRLRLQLFGAPRLLRGEDEVRLTVRKSMALLAVVAIERRVTRAKLAQLFWGDNDAAAARRNLRRELHRLREAGLAEALETDDDTVALAGEVACDAHAHALALAAEHTEEALALQAGVLMDGFELADGGGFDDWLARQREALAHGFAQTCARWVRVLEARGQVRDALRWQLRLLAAEPLQEAHTAQAMRLHEQLDERAQALELYERLGLALRRELGLDPLPATRALAERLRAAQRIAPLLRRARDDAALHLDAPLVGREAELAWLAGTGAAIRLVVGDAGVGKTRLVTEFALDHDPCVRLAGSALARHASLAPLAETLRHAEHDPALRERLRALPPATQAELARLLPAAGAAPRTEDPSDGGALARSRFFEALTTALAAVTAGGVLLIDDWHWLDEGTLEVIEELALRPAAAGGRSPRIVATARSAELQSSAPVIERVRKLERLGVLERRAIAPLAPEATLRLVQALSGSGGAQRFSERLQRVTQGNPFFMLETLRFLFTIGELSVDAQGVWSTRYDEHTGDYQELPVPPSVQEAVLERVERLGPAARRVLEVAALAGDPFELADVQPATALPEWDALDGVERLLQAQLLRAAEPAGYRYVHDLARGAIDAALRPERRRLIHLRLAEGLEARRGAPARIALHFEDAGQTERALPHRLAAARAAEAVFAYREAADHLAAALPSLPAAEQAALHRSRVRLLRRLHDLPAVAAELDAIEALAGPLATPALQAEALCGRAALAIRHQRYADALAHAEAALAHPALAEVPAADLERLPLDHAFALVERARYDEARAIYDREFARAAAPESACSAAFRGELHHGMANLYTSFGDDAPAREHLRQAVALFGEAGDIERRLRSLNILAYTEFTLGDPLRAIEIMDRALEDAERLKLVTTLRNTLTNFIAYLLPAGHIERARQVHARAMELLAQVGDPATQARLAIREAEIRSHAGQIGAAFAALRQAIELIERNAGGFPDFWAWHMLGRLHWWCGDTDEPVRLYEALTASPAALPSQKAAVRVFSLAFSIGSDPTSAREIAAALAAAEPSPGLLAHPESIAFWHAWALGVAGEPAQALALLEPPAGPLAAHPFGESPGRYLALRVTLRAALGQPVEALRAASVAALENVPAFVALELLVAWAAAEPQEPAWQARARTLAHALHASLADEPRLQACFRRRWQRQLA